MRRAHRTLSEEAIRFRRAVIDSLCVDIFGYINADRVVGQCPICGEAIGVYFHGRAPRATLTCRGAGCSEEEIAGVLGLAVRS